LIISNTESRDNLITLYRNELNQLLTNQEAAQKQLQYVLYLVHQLEYFGEFTPEHKTKLNEIFLKQTSYFSNWVDAIDKLPDSTWTMWWLSEYDIQREEI